MESVASLLRITASLPTMFFLLAPEVFPALRQGHKIMNIARNKQGLGNSLLCYFAITPE